MPKIEWVEDMDKALSVAKQANKAIFLDFFNPN